MPQALSVSLAPVANLGENHRAPTTISGPTITPSLQLSATPLHRLPEPNLNERDRLVAAAADAQRSGKFDVAGQFAQNALDLDPGCVAAKFLLGVAHARLGQNIQAAGLLTQVLDADPRAYEALISLSTIYRESGKSVEAISIGGRAVQVRPNDAQAHNNLGRCFLAARRLSEASGAFIHAIRLQPTFSAAFYNLGKTLQLEGKDGEAARSFAQAASLAPNLENLLALGQMLLTLCDFERAKECAQRSVQLYPDSAAAHLLLCGALTEVNEIDAADLHLTLAIELDPNRREALQLAARQRPLGYIEEANENLRHAIEQNPRQVSAYDSLMLNQKVTERDRGLIDKMRSLLNEVDLSQTELVSIHYGLGKALEDLREFEEAMSHYDEANRLTRQIKFGDMAFDEDRYSRHVNRMIEAFSACQRSRLEADPSELPVLIIGMMRSGTSLAEQILSSHSRVKGAGEQLFWTKNWSRALLDGSSSLDNGIAGKLGEEYVEELRAFGPDAARVTDKMPGNCMFAGLIHLALPNARFIHIRRSPVDTCLSIWATPNHMPHEGGNHKGNIAFVYKQYMRLMEEWRTVLPPDRFLEVDYEALVADPENQIRSMVAFCGLEWDKACLKPHENKRLVATPSAWQVRQPVYATSVAKWRSFEPWLGEFRELLDLRHPGSADF